MNSRRNLFKFYDSTFEKNTKYLITNIIIFFSSNLKIIYLTKDSTFMSMNSIISYSAMCTFESIVAFRFVQLVENCSKSLTYVGHSDFLKQQWTVF